MIKLGITGGIGSGKSFVAQRLRDSFQVPVYDTDREAKRLMCEHDGISADLRALLGDEVYIENGILNKPLLIKYLFAAKENAEKINTIVHPRVKEDFHMWCVEQEKKGVKIVAVESAILFESGFDKEVNRVITVYASLETRIIRVMRRDRVTREQVLARVKAQISEEERRKHSDYVVSTEEGEDLNTQLHEILLSCISARKEW